MRKLDDSCPKSLPVSFYIAPWVAGESAAPAANP
jgi:hypothetical protein